MTRPNAFLPIAILTIIIPLSHGLFDAVIANMLKEKCQQTSGDATQWTIITEVLLSDSRCATFLAEKSEKGTDPNKFGHKYACVKDAVKPCLNGQELQMVETIEDLYVDNSIILKECFTGKEEALKPCFESLEKDLTNKVDIEQMCKAENEFETCVAEAVQQCKDSERVQNWVDAAFQFERMFTGCLRSAGAESLGSLTTLGVTAVATIAAILGRVKFNGV